VVVKNFGALYTHGGEYTTNVKFALLGPQTQPSAP
jgi:hypothetical protein